jgi:hypothetical protein
MATYVIWAIWANDTKTGTSQMVANNIDTPSTVEYCSSSTFRNSPAWCGSVQQPAWCSASRISNGF